MMHDLTQQKNNPTRWIQDNYQQLMSIQDPQELASFVLQGVQPMIGHGFSAANFKKMQLTIRKLSGNLVALKQYLSNYLLSGAGLAAIESEQYAIASMIAEDCEVVRLSQYQMSLKRLVESNSRFKVKLISEST